MKRSIQSVNYRKYSSNHLSYLSYLRESHINKIQDHKDSFIENDENYPMILNLVLYSDNDYYRGMYENTREYYNKHKNLDTIYYMYSENETDEYRYDRDNNILYIRGKETFIPGILDKTVKAFQFVPLLGKKYDYIIRTNISTLVNIRKLSYQLMKNPVDYGGGIVAHIYNGYRDYKSGINNDRYKGIFFPYGTFIIFSIKLFDKMIEKIHLIDRSVIDDVSIGHFMARYFREYSINSYSQFYYNNESDKYLDESNIKNIDVNRYIFFRNKNKDRYKDIKSINTLIAHIK